MAAEPKTDNQQQAPAPAPPLGEPILKSMVPPRDKDAEPEETPAMSSPPQRLTTGEHLTRSLLPLSIAGTPAISEVLLPTLSRLHGAGMDWQVDPRLTSFVSKVLVPRFPDFESLECASVVKKNRHRTVLRLATDAGVVYVKVFAPGGAAEKLKSLVQPSKAMIEWRHARRLDAAAIPTAAPAFVAERRRAGVVTDCTVGFFAVPGARDYAIVLDEARALPPEESEEQRRRLSTALAVISHEMFQIGALHGDYHVGNVLVDGRGEVTVIDLHAVRFVTHIYRWQKLDVLGRMAVSHAPFDHAKRGFALPEIHWFARAYAELDPELGDPEALEAALLEEAARHEATRLRSRDKRCLVHSTLFTNTASLGRRVFRRRSVPEDEIIKACDAPGIATLHESSRSIVEVIKAPPGMARTVAELRDGVEPETVIRKRTFSKRFTSTLGTAVAGSKGLRSWRAARAFEVRKLPTAHALALHEERVAGVMTPGSTLFLEHLEGTEQLHRVLQQTLGGGEPGGPIAPTRRFKLTRQLAMILVQLQESGIRHKDLAVQNVLVRDRDGVFELFVVDLDTVRMAPVRLKDKLRNLVHLSDLPAQARPVDKLRFFRDYLALGGDQLLQKSLAELGRKGLIRHLSALLDERMEAKRVRMARKGEAWPEPSGTEARPEA